MPSSSMNLGSHPGIGLQYAASADHVLFYKMVVDDLWQIRSKPLGKTLLDRIATARPRTKTTQANRNAETESFAFSPGTNVVITPTTISHMQSSYRQGAFIGSSTTNREVVASNAPQHNVQHLPFYRLNGSYTEAADGDAADDKTGSVSIIRYSNATTKVEGGVLTPSFIVLAHELIHSLHHLTGSRLRDGNEEERRTTGIGAYANDELTENAFRQAFGLPLRLDYRTAH